MPTLDGNFRVLTGRVYTCKIWHRSPIRRFCRFTGSSRKLFARTLSPYCLFNKRVVPKKNRAQRGGVVMPTLDENFRVLTGRVYTHARNNHGEEKKPIVTLPLFSQSVLSVQFRSFCSFGGIDERNAAMRFVLMFSLLDARNCSMSLSVLPRGRKKGHEM